MKRYPDLFDLIGKDRLIVPSSEAPMNTGISGWIVGDEQVSTHYLKNVMGYKEHRLDVGNNIRICFWSKPNKKK